MTNVPKVFKDEIQKLAVKQYLKDEIENGLYTRKKEDWPRYLKGYAALCWMGGVITAKHTLERLAVRSKFDLINGSKI